ncbi:MAG: PAS domain-containing protein [Candidatus Scalindua sp.]|nr:PAS domain-containing protein [Candidatus Scalindua sp.]
MFLKRIEQLPRCTLLIIILSALVAEAIGLLIAYQTVTTKTNLVIIAVTIHALLLVPLLFLFVYKPLSAYTNNNLKLNEDFNILKNELFESEQKFRLIAEFSYDCEYWEGLDKSFLYISPSCATITGYSPWEFYQNKELLKEIINPDDLRKWEAYHHGMSKDGEIDSVEFRITTKSGETRWIDHVSRNVYDERGENRGIRGSNRDITKLKLLKKEVKMLKGFLPICASCKNIRDDKGYWNQIESYIRDHSEAEFSHGICPDCAKKLYSELDLYKEK